MVSSGRDKYAAGEQGLGYLYQPRLALLRILDLPESAGVLVEGLDDLELTVEQGGTLLASLKHKAEGGRLTDLSTDFWKSVWIWLQRYTDSGGIRSSFRFLLFTTETVPNNSFLSTYVEGKDRAENVVKTFVSTMDRSAALVIQKVRKVFLELDVAEQADFLARIEILPKTPRIEELPRLIIDQHLRTVRRQFRGSVFERLEGWWCNLVVELLTGKRTDPIHGYEVSDKLALIAEEYHSDNLPITFAGKQPAAGIDPQRDERMFVQQLRALNVNPTRIRHAITDYFRAFEQRSSWAREELLVIGEVEEYEDRLVEEWSRYKAVVCEDLAEDCEDDDFIVVGKALLRWAEYETSHIRIRERVTEPYVVRGGFHILANGRPYPRIHWHPKFLERLQTVLEGAS